MSAAARIAIAAELKRSGVPREDQLAEDLLDRLEREGYLIAATSPAPAAAVDAVVKGLENTLFQRVPGAELRELGEAAAQAALEHRPRVVLNAEEQEAMTALLRAMSIIRDSWGLTTNESELVQAVHVIQAFIVQHMLARLEPTAWGRWYKTLAGPPERRGPTPDPGVTAALGDSPGADEVQA